MWFLLIYIQLTAIQAQNQIALRGSNSPCEGYLDVSYNNQWGLVGHHQWTDINGEVVCKSLGCGKHIKSGVLYEDYKNPLQTNFWLDEVVCTGRENYLWECRHNGWNVTHCHSHNFISVKCSGDISLSLNLNGMTDECAGRIQFKTPIGNFSVCNQNWNPDKLCQDLKCGNHKKIISSIISKENSHTVPLNCTGNEDFLWQCVDWVNSATCQQEITIICSRHNPVRLRGGPDVCEGTLELKNGIDGKWAYVPCKDGDYKKFDRTCAKLNCDRAEYIKPCNESKNTWLKCSNRVTLELRHRGKSSRCHGNLYVKVNDGHHAVCVKYSSSYKSISEMVCRELRCGIPLSVEQSSQQQQSQFRYAEYHGQAKSLWEYIHTHGAVENCSAIMIICSESLEMHLSNGLDSCTGQLEVKLFDSWWSMSSGDWDIRNSDMVCQHLECGKATSNKYHFVKSKLNILGKKLTCSGSNISHCTMESKDYNLKDSVVTIICSKHELWFLQGNSQCEGIIKGDIHGYLQNVTNEKAAETCRRNLCGSMLMLESNNSNLNSSVCSKNASSSFNCSMKNITTSTEPRYPYVNCSGSMGLQLEHACYGKVLVGSDNTRGVCGDTWTDKESGMLCKTLGCGQMITNIGYSGSKTPGVTVASVHCKETAENFRQCNFLQLKNPSLCTNPAYVICTGSVHAVLDFQRDRCAGNLKLFYSGSLKPLCVNGISKTTENAICRNMSCGESLGFTKVINSINNSVGLTDIACKDSDISKCDFSKIKEQKCNLGYLKCSGWRRLLITDTKTACAGIINFQNETDIYTVNSDGWGKQESNELCKYLECGDVSGSQSNSDTESSNRIWDKMEYCGCDKMATVNNSLHISCNATAEPQLTLSGKCTGEVRIINKHICKESQIPEQVFHEFCQDQGCSMFFKSWSNAIKSNAHYLSCTGKESKLWQCSSLTDNCENVISVACANAIQWNFSQHCGGELQVNYRGQWEPVCPLDRNDAERICNDLNCGHVHKMQSVKANADVSIKCDKKQNFMMHCFKPEPEGCTEKAVIHCEKYTVKTPPRIGLIVGITSGIMLLVVAAVIVVLWRKRFLAILRFKPSDEDSDEEIENERQSLNDKGDYGDVGETANPIEGNQNQEVASEYEEEDNMSTSNDSSGTEYDDVDQENVKRSAASSPTVPLLPPRPDNIHDEVTFEAEGGSQTEYDDVVLHKTKVSEQSESFDIPGPSTVPPLLVSNEEVKAQEDE